ncbi:hypothetical protein PINS_up007846 [Pythium insidiosum]|nr:hypothetical protein PINS_up007846 [Pythium insidiosum]
MATPSNLVIELDDDDMELTGSSRSVARLSGGPADDERITSSDPIAIQFFWQGYEVYAHDRESNSAVPCFFKSQCGCSQENGSTAEFLRIVPVDELPERSIWDDMKVQLVSVTTGRYLRVTRVSKFLRWSETRDEQTVFQIQILDRSKPLNRDSKFTFASTFWPGHYIGFTESCPIGAGRGASKAIGFLTIEKKKHQAPLLFPVRFKAVHRALRFRRVRATSSSTEDPVPLVVPSEVEFIDSEQHDAVADIPVAVVLSGRNNDEIRETCPYCNVLFRRRDSLLAHIRDSHGDWLRRPSVPGTYCPHCGQRRSNGVCRRCDSAARA